MANEPFLAFLDKALQDSALQEQLSGALDAEAVASVAHAAGCTDVTADQVSAFFAEVDSQQEGNGDQELEGVTGGLSKAGKWATYGTMGVAAVGLGAATVAVLTADSATQQSLDGHMTPDFQGNIDNRRKVNEALAKAVQW